MPSQAYEIPGFKYPLEASADLSAGQYRAVVCDSNGQAARAGAGVHIDGVQQDKPDAQGKACEIMQTGITKAEAGAAVAKGAELMTDSSGRFITATSTNFIVGRAHTAAGAAGEYMGVLLKSEGIKA